MGGVTHRQWVCQQLTALVWVSFKVTVFSRNFSPLVISEDCKVPVPAWPPPQAAYSLPRSVGQEKMDALKYLPAVFLSELDVCMGCLSLCPTPFQNKRVPKTKAPDKQISPLNYVYYRSADWFSLGQRWGCLGAGGTFSRLLTGGMSTSPFPCYQNPAKHKPNRVCLLACCCF